MTGGYLFEKGKIKDMFHFCCGRPFRANKAARQGNQRV